MRLCGVMGQILLCGVVWVDEVSVHKKLEKRVEIDENKPSEDAQKDASQIPLVPIASMLTQCKSVL